ncbi:hypothetical protein COOONC_08307 [Cooperia oncophora]
MFRVHGESSSNGCIAGQNFTLTEVIETWIYQQGFPVLHVKKRNDGKVQVTQEIYRHIPGHKRSGVQWKIPLFLRDPITLKPTVQWLVENDTAYILTSIPKEFVLKTLNAACIVCNAHLHASRRFFSPSAAIAF